MESRPGFVVGYRTWRITSRVKVLLANGVATDARWAEWHAGEEMVATCNGAELCCDPAVEPVMVRAVLGPRSAVIVGVGAGNVLPRTTEVIAPDGYLRTRHLVSHVLRLARSLRGDEDVDDTPPGRSCRCGIHAWLKPQHYNPHHLAERALIHGAVAAWGKVVPHPGEGFRAERARIIAFERPRTHTAPAEWIAAAFGVPLLDPGYIEAFAREYGEDVEPRQRITWGNLPGRRTFVGGLACRRCGVESHVKVRNRANHSQIGWRCLGCGSVRSA